MPFVRPSWPRAGFAALFLCTGVAVLQMGYFSANSFRVATTKPLPAGSEFRLAFDTGTGFTAKNTIPAEHRRADIFLEPVQQLRLGVDQPPFARTTDFRLVTAERSAEGLRSTWHWSPHEPIKIHNADVLVVDHPAATRTTVEAVTVNGSHLERLQSDEAQSRFRSATPIEPIWSMVISTNQPSPLPTNDNELPLAQLSPPFQAISGEPAQTDTTLQSLTLLRYVAPLNLSIPLAQLSAEELSDAISPANERTTAELTDRGLHLRSTSGDATLAYRTEALTLLLQAVSRGEQRLVLSLYLALIAASLAGALLPIPKFFPMLGRNLTAKLAHNLDSPVISRRTLYAGLFLAGLALLLGTPALPTAVSSIIAVVVFALGGILLSRLPSTTATTTTWDRWIPPCLALILAVGFTLRYWGLTNLDPYTDEYMHLLAARQLLDAGAFEYSRGALVTYAAAAGYWIGQADSFLEYLYWARLPGVLVSTLTVVPIYLIGRRISPGIGLVSALLWATSPWAIAVARTVREYAYYPLITLLALLATLQLIELLLAWKRKSLPAALLLFFGLIAFTGYAFFVDVNSTLKMGVLSCVAGGLAELWIRRDALRSQYLTHRHIVLTIVVTSLIGLLGLILVGFITGQLALTVAPRWLLYFIVPDGSPMHWWGALMYAPLTVVGLLGLSGTYAWRRNYAPYLVPALAFTGLMIFMLFFFNRYVRPRYIIYALPFFSILAATGISGVFALAWNVHGRIARTALVAVTLAIALLLIRPSTVTYPARSTVHGYVLPTNEYHDRVREAITYLRSHAQPDDVFIGTIFEPLVQLELGIPAMQTLYYDYDDPQRFENVEAFVQAHNRGYMVLDDRRNNGWTPGYPTQGTFLIGETPVTVVQRTPGLTTYHWARKP